MLILIGCNKSVSPNCENESINMCNNCTDDYSCILGSWDYEEHVVVSVPNTTECIKVMPNYSDYQDWELNIQSDGVFSGFTSDIPSNYLWTANIDTLIFDLDILSIYFLTSLNNDRLTLHSIESYISEDCSLECDFESYITFAPNN